MSKNDELFDITDQIWEMAKIGGALETRRNVGSFLGNFRGYLVDIDKIANKILKNRMLSEDKRAQIIEIHQKIREQLKAIDEEKRKNLKEYVQKTKYFFNSKKFYELKKKQRCDKNE
jgi:Spy/CpxP family protein refolding chaperone